CYKACFLTFEREIRTFLLNYGIEMPTEQFRNDWVGFEAVYCDILEDAELEYTGKAVDLHYINGARVTRYDPTAQGADSEFKPGEALPVAIKWMFTWNGDPVFAFVITYPSEAFVAAEKERKEKDSVVKTSSPEPNPRPSQPPD